jgi:mRNA-degrading endonuclease toxin of MazEF toxin-antitoxin module
MAERGRLYLWPRNRSFGDSKARPVVVISPDAATRHGRRWVVLPLSTVSDLASNPLAYRLAPTATNGLRQASFVMTWLPTSVHADQLQGPLGRLTSAELTAAAQRCDAISTIRCAAGLLPLKAPMIRGACGARGSNQQPHSQTCNQQPQTNSQG